ncbi:MAG: hypothetical protein JW880_00875 [Candidatus Thermoplasmatota archaeon]|nr:hypothetical protein [Candidatus Thermoplasmatota archaeon]
MKRCSEAEPRKTVYEVVVRCPGVHLRGIERMTALPLGVVRYHLERLQRDELLFSKEDRHFRRFFPSSELPKGRTETFDVLRQEGLRRIVLHLLNSPGATHGSMAAVLSIPASTLSTHLATLLRKKVVRRERREGRNMYFVADEESVVKVLVVYRQSFLDKRVDQAISTYLKRG